MPTIEDLDRRVTRLEEHEITTLTSAVDRLSDTTARGFEEFRNAFIESRGETRKGFAALDSRLTSVEQRVGRLEETVSGIKKDVESVKATLTSMEGKIGNIEKILQRHFD